VIRIDNGQLSVKTETTTLLKLYGVVQSKANKA